MVFQDGSTALARWYFSRTHYAKIIVLLKYNSSGNFVKKYNFDDSAPKSIVPDSMMDELYHLIWQ